MAELPTNNYRVTFDSEDHLREYIHCNCAILVDILLEEVVYNDLEWIDTLEHVLEKAKALAEEETNEKE